MRRLVIALLLGAVLPAGADEQDTQREIQRALIQRDQQSAQFAAQLRGETARRELEALHARRLEEAGRALHSDPVIARELRPYERERMAQESRHVLRLPPPVERGQADAEPGFRKPLPLPGGARHGVEPIAAPSVGG